MLHDIKNAEEVTQSVFIDLWENRNETEVDNNIKSVLLNSTHYACLEHIKHQKVIKKPEELIQVIITEKNSEAIQNEEKLRVQISNMISALPEECHKVFMMNRTQKKSYKEIATELGTNLKSVEAQMGNALRVLIDGLKTDGQISAKAVKTLFWFGSGISLINFIIA